MPFSCNLSNTFFLENIPLLDMFDIGDARGLWSPCRTDSSTARSAGSSGHNGSDGSLSGIDWDWLYADVDGVLDVHNPAGEQELWGQEGHHSSTRTYRYKVYPYSWKLL